MSERTELGSPVASAACETMSYGILKDGTRFPAPETMSVMTALITPKSWRSPTTIIWILSWIVVGLSGVLFFTGVLPKWFFCLQFAFWRLAYNIGIGFMLYTQSNGGHFLKFYQHLMKTYPKMKGFLEASIVFKDSTEYKVDKFPDEFNAWMLFRQFENVILANDLVAYEVLFLVCLHPLRVDSFLDIIYILIGAGSVAFALWSKSDAHRVIGDFAWYWGDFFFLLDKNLTFDGIFQMFPHPMYTVGYAFMYGLPIMARSYTLFYMSVFGHLCQIAFLAFVENPHIDRTYGQCEEIGEEEKQRKEILYGDGQNEEYLEERELVVLMHFDGFRTSDLLLGLSVFYLLLSLFFSIPAWIYVVHGLAWRVVIHTGCIGYVLRMESSEKWFSKHYATPTKAFINWKRIYNASVTITNLSFVLCALKLCTWDSIIGEGLNVRILLSVVGGLLIGINVYVSTSIYHTVGVYGYYYGDFFISNVVPKLVYNGIYRYTNNPDSLFGVCAYYGIALISGSKVVLCMAVMTHLCTKAFEVLVEKPHMKKIYGSQLRKAGGLRTELHRRIKQVEQNVRKLKPSHEPEIPAEACKSDKKNL